MMNGKTILFGGLLGVSATQGLCAAAATQGEDAGARRPNVVIFLTDDQGAIDLNCFGAEDLRTPHIDALAERGVRFTRFYANSSISSPSRAALLTGCYPQRAGVPLIVRPDSTDPGLPPGATTLADVLKEHGYATAAIGKWHLGYRAEAHPNAHGFDYFFGHLGGCIDNYSHFFYWQGPNRHDLYCNREEVWYSGENFSDLMVREAASFIEAHRDSPFFLYFSSNYPHYPLQGDAKWRNYYDDLPSPRDKYAAMVSTIDEKIGRIIEKLEREGLLDDTIIVFMSDNGFSREERAFYGGGSAGGLRGEKFSVYEGGIRVPAILSYPGHVAEGGICEEVALGFDWFPTILDLCRIDLSGRPIDGRSLVPVLAGAPSPHEVVNWQVNKRWAVYKGGYKLVGEIRKGEETVELYCLDEDMGETRDLSASRPDIVADLTYERHLWLDEVGRR